MFIVLGLLLFISFFLSGSETALTAVNRMKVQFRADQGDKKSEKLLTLISKPDRMITAILVGNNIVNIMLPVLVTMIAIDNHWKVGVATAVLTVVLIMFGEVLPKTIAATFADRIAYIVAPVISMFVRALTPITALLSLFTNVFIRIISKGTVTEATLTKEDLRSLVDIAATEGTFEQEESLRLKEVLDFPDKDVSDVLATHRTEIIGLPIDSTYEEVRDTILEYFYTRYPVYEESMDNIIGMFYSKKLIEWSMDPERTLREMIDLDPIKVVQTATVEKQNKLMLAKKKHMAIVLDEYGGTLGLVTHEDIIEEMIGQDIEDETDIDEEVLVYEMKEHKLICHGRLEIRDVMELLEVDIPTENETIGGFVLQELGHLPEPGERFTFENLRFCIDEMDRSRIIKMTIVKKVEEEENKSEA